MDAQVKKALDVMLTNWNSMWAPDSEDSEGAANGFEASFYEFIDVLRKWVDALDHRPQTAEELLELPMIRDIIDALPAPLHLNFETEAELIVDNIRRVDDAKYD